MNARPLFDADGAAVISLPNRVLFARQGALWAQPLDMTTLLPTGAPLPIASQVFVSADYFADVGLSASSTGTVAYRENGGKRQLVWLIAPALNRRSRLAAALFPFGGAMERNCSTLDQAGV